MPSLAQHRRRREQFLDRIDRPVLLMAGSPLPRNYPDNPFPFRADSNFLFFFDHPEPGSAAFFDPEERSVTLFLEPRTPDGALWHGEVPDFAAMAEQQGCAIDSNVDLATGVSQRAKGRKVDGLAIADPRATAQAAAITGDALDFFTEAGQGRAEVVLLLAELRTYKDPEEVDAMRCTAAVTDEAHRAAMGHTRAGILEQVLAGHVDGCFWRNGCVPAYNSILSVRGEVLHNHDHGNELKDGDLVLLDAGAEAPSGYCSDVTRTWPVTGRFTAEQAAIYDAVLAGQLAAIEAYGPGVRYRDVHLRSAQVMTESLVEMGLIKGKAEDAVARGAHAVFFPHGVGHQIGLDVHDMEAFGDQVHYPGGRDRSTDFGTRFLRTDVDVQPGMVMTIEPGIYFVPAILRNQEMRSQFSDFVDFDAAEKWLAMNDGRGFGGIRIEDDVLATEGGREVLTAAIPKTRDDVEAAVGAML